MRRNVLNWIIADIYNWPILIYIGKWSKLRKKVLKHYDYDIGDMVSDGGAHLTICDDKLTYCSVIWLSEYCKYTLIHELLHASMTILSTVGIKFSPNHQEALCYLHESLCIKAKTC